MCGILFIIVCVCELKGYNSYKPLTSFDRKLIGSKQIFTVFIQCVQVCEVDSGKRKPVASLSTSDRQTGNVPRPWFSNWG